MYSHFQILNFISKFSFHVNSGALYHIGAGRPGCEACWGSSCCPPGSETTLESHFRPDAPRARAVRGGGEPGAASPDAVLQGEGRRLGHSCLAWACSRALVAADSRPLRDVHVLTP